MDKLKQLIAFTLLAILVVVAGSWFLLISPKRSEAAEIRQQVASQEKANASLRTQISVLKAQAKALPRKQAALAAAAAKIPDNPALPSLIRALTVAADDAGVDLLSMSPAKPQALAAAADPAAAQTPVSAAPADAGSSAAAGQLMSISLNLSISGGYFQVEQFLDRLESLTRAMRVSTVAMAPGENPVAKAAAAPGPGKPAAAPAPAAPSKSTNLITNITASVFMAQGRVTGAASAPAPGK